MREGGEGCGGEREGGREVREGGEGCGGERDGRREVRGAVGREREGGEGGR